AGAIGLDPFAIDHKLWDSALACALDDLVEGAGGGFNVDLGVLDIVLGEEAFGLAAVGAPGGGIDGEFHELILEERLDRRLLFAARAFGPGSPALPLFSCPGG